MKYIIKPLLIILSYTYSLTILLLYYMIVLCFALVNFIWSFNFNKTLINLKEECIDPIVARTTYLTNRFNIDDDYLHFWGSYTSYRLWKTPLISLNKRLFKGKDICLHRIYYNTKLSKLILITLSDDDSYTIKNFNPVKWNRNNWKVAILNKHDILYGYTDEFKVYKRENKDVCDEIDETPKKFISKIYDFDEKDLVSISTDVTRYFRNE